MNNQELTVRELTVRQLTVLHTYVDPSTALYSRSIWNCFGSHDGTTNACEGYQCTTASLIVNTHFHGRHPDFYAFIKFLRQQDAELELRIRQLETGAPARKRKATYVAVDAALDRLRETYFTGRIPSVGQLTTYIDAVAHQLYDVKH